MDIKQQEINEIIQIIQTFKKNGLSKEKEKNKKTTRIPLILTYNRTLRNVEKIIASNWNLLQINKEFQQTPIFAFRRKDTLHDLLRCKNVVNNRVQKNSKKKIGFFTNVSRNRETCLANKFYIEAV